MRFCDVDRKTVNINSINDTMERFLNPSSIILPRGYQIEVFAVGLNGPNNLIFDDFGTMLISESGLSNQNPRVLRLREGRYELIAEGFRTPITGITYHGGNIYVAHRGYITLVKPDGVKQDIMSGLPSNGDYGNSNVAFSPDGMMYFGQGTITNSGVVGIDNSWVKERPFLHDNPGSYIMLNGQNFASQNIMVSGDELTYTGAFSPYGETNVPYEVRKGVAKASGSILRANSDGTNLEMVAWGLRYPSRIKFDENYRLFTTNIGYENRGSRPVANAPCEFVIINEGVWYGWPDFAGGEPLTDPRFWPEGGRRIEFLLTNHPDIPPRPFALFPSYSNTLGFDFNYGDFGPYGDAYVAEFGGASVLLEGSVTPYAGFGHRVSKIDMKTGGVTTFAINKSGFSTSITKEGGLGRPVDVTFGPDNSMYILDYGINAIDNPNIIYPDTGVIWRVTKTI